MSERQVQGNQAGEFSIPADIPAEKSVTLILPPGLQAKYTVWKKDIPDNIPATWTDQENKTYTIKWINNFGLKRNNRFVKNLGTSDPPFQVRLEKEAGKKLFYYEDGVKEFTTVTDVPGNQVVVQLRSGDPPIGWGI